MAVQWGLQHSPLDGIESLGIDELYWSRRHQYLTLVYQIDAGAKRLLWIGRKRTLKTLLGFFRWFGPKRSQALRFICSDTWKACLRVVAKKAAQYERRKPRSFTPAVSSPSSPARVGCGSNEPADSARTAPSKSPRSQPWAPTRAGRHPQILLRSRNFFSWHARDTARSEYGCGRAELRDGLLGGGESNWRRAPG